MTHQLQIMTGLGTIADSMMRQLHYRMLEKFDECWVVDEQENGGLAGALSHPRQLPLNARYLGLLSQLIPLATPVEAQPNKILVLLSGPEPMRSILEEKLLQQAASASDYQFHIIAGNPVGSANTHLPAHITYTTHVNAKELATALAHAQLIICRSGYSTLMDLVVFEKKALLIPTPGQSEQQYLAGYLQAQGVTLSRQQSEIDLGMDIAEALHYTGFTTIAHTGKSGQMQEVIDNALRQLENEAGHS